MRRSFGSLKYCTMSLCHLELSSRQTMSHAPDLTQHTISGPYTYLVRGCLPSWSGSNDIGHEDEYVDECHFCYTLRLALIDRFPQFLAPRQVYGL